MPCNVDAVTSPRDTREPLSLSLHYIGSFLRFRQQVEHNASLFQYVLFRRTLQNYIKLFNSHTSDCEIHIKCDGFVHYLAFDIRFRLRILVNGAVGRWATTKYGVGRGLYAPYHGLRKVAGRSHNPYKRAARYSPFVFFSVKSEQLSAICETADCRFLCTFAVEKVQ